MHDRPVDSDEDDFHDRDYDISTMANNLSREIYQSGFFDNEDADEVCPLFPSLFCLNFSMVLNNVVNSDGVMIAGTLLKDEASCFFSFPSVLNPSFFFITYRTENMKSFALLFFLNAAGHVVSRMYFLMMNHQRL